MSWAQLFLRPSYAPAQRSRPGAWSKVSASLHEGIAGIALIQATARERFERRHFVRSLVGSIRASFRRDLLRMFSRRTSMLVNQLGMFLVIFVGAYRIIEGASTIGDFFAFFMYLGRVFGATSGLTELNPQLQNGLASLERIYEVLDTEPQIKNKPDAKPLPM